MPLGQDDSILGGFPVHPILPRYRSFWVTFVLVVASLCRPSSCTAAVTREEVERAIRDGVRFLKQEQRADGSWADVENDARTGVTSMVALALLTAGERQTRQRSGKRSTTSADSSRNDLHSTYAIALQTMVFAGAEPAKDKVQIAATSNGSKKPRSSRATPSCGRARGATPNRRRAGPATIPTPSTPCSACTPPARSASPSNRLSGLWRGYWETQPEARRKLGLYPRFQ